jgi:hypothetical protein
MAIEKETLGRDHGIGRFPEMAESSVEVSDEAVFAKIGEVESVIGRGRGGPSGGQRVEWDGVERVKMSKGLMRLDKDLMKDIVADRKKTCG